MRGLWRLIWLELKIFVREPLGLLATVGVPVLIFVLLGRVMEDEVPSADTPRFLTADLPILVSILIAVNAVLSLVTIITIYREGGILKRLRATPLRPYTILTAHVIVKLLFTAMTLGLMVLAGRRYLPSGADVPLLSFSVALLFTTTSILSLGFLIASVVPTARFAQPIASVILYPMLAVSGLFAPVDALPPVLEGITRVLPLTYAVSLLRGIWHGAGWAAHAVDMLALTLLCLTYTAIATKVFRWE